MPQTVTKTFKNIHKHLAVKTRLPCSGHPRFLESWLWNEVAPQLEAVSQRFDQLPWQLIGCWCEVKIPFVSPQKRTDLTKHGVLLFSLPHLLSCIFQQVTPQLAKCEAEAGLKTDIQLHHRAFHWDGGSKSMLGAAAPSFRLNCRTFCKRFCRPQIAHKMHRTNVHTTWSIHFKKSSPKTWRLVHRPASTPELDPLSCNNVHKTNREANVSTISAAVLRCFWNAKASSTEVRSSGQRASSKVIFESTTWPKAYR